eukprot:1171269-Ditylum_brightwellii.AAC.1
MSAISLAPVHVVTTDGMVMWKDLEYHGIVGDIKVCQDSTFQTYLDFLDKWESRLLQNIGVKYPIHKIILRFSQEKFLIATDGSSGSDAMSFGWKICRL